MAGYIGSKAVITSGVSASIDELNTLDGVTAVVGELNALDLGSTAVGTAIASKAVILDSNKDYTGIRNLTVTGNAVVSGTALTTGVHTFTAVPVFPNNTVETADIQADAITGAKIADDAINSEHYTDGSIDTAHIADQAINEAKMQISNGPSNGYMLTAQSGNTGGMTWAAAPSGYRTLIASVTASSAGTVLLEGMDNTYDHYQVFINNILPATDEGYLSARVKSGGSIDTGSNYQWRGRTFDSGSTGTAAHNNNSDTSWGYIVRAQGNVSTETAHVILDLFNPSSTSTFKKGFWRAAAQDTNARPSYNSGVLGWKTSGSAYTGIQFFYASGNIASGVFKLYGITT